ncbi:MAG: hypothetical protein AAB037_05230 [Chloroflexota bacterium]
MKRLLVPSTMLLLVLLSLSLLAGCRQPSASPGSTSVPTAPTSTAASTQATTPSPSSAAAPLLLIIVEPIDESVVEVSVITIRGRTLADAVVSVNGELADVDSNGNFSVQVTLDEGPNVLDVIATDEGGNEVTAQLIVSFAP